MSDQPRIAGAGICCQDYIIVAPQAVWGGSAGVKDYIVQGGGLVGTAMVACARLGARCEFFSLLGNDQVGAEVVAELAREGVAIDGVARIEGAKSPFSFIHVDDKSGDRTIFFRAGQDLEWRDSAPLERIGQCGALLIDDCYPDLAIAAASLAREHGVPVVADIIPGPRNAEIVGLVDILIAPKHYTGRLGLEDNLDAALDVIREQGPTTAVITLGAEGWVYADATGTGRGEAFSVDVVDTTGAGDTFHGAFSYGVAMGWSTAKCCEFASAVAAIKCTKPGGRTGLPSLEQALHFLRERGRTGW